MSNYTSTKIIVNFMSAIRKVPLNKFSFVRDALECIVTKVAGANQINVFDSYIENSIKESTKASRSNDVEPIAYANLLLQSPPQVELEWFWASSKNNKEL